MKTAKKQAAQGDVLFVRLDKLPKDAIEVMRGPGALVVAHSETGHHHQIPSEHVHMYASAEPLRSYIKVDSAADVIHMRSFDTHETLRLAPGIYEVRRQREHTPEGWRRVED